MGIFPMLWMMRSNRPSGPSWCQRNNCNCPCHTEGFADRHPVVTGLSIVVVVLWVMLTFAMWAMPMDGHPTLVQVLRNEWSWIANLARRIW